MKIKILSFDYDETTGTTYMTAATKYGVFSSVSKCHKEDLPYFSKFLGGQICETKCLIKAFQQKKRMLNIQLKEAKTNYNSIYLNRRNKKASLTLKARIKFLEIKIHNYDVAIANLKEATESNIDSYLKDKKAIRNK